MAQKGGFNFQVKAGLDVRNFNKGVSQLQRSMQKLKSSFLGFAGGMGLAMGFENLISSVKDTALELNTAMNTLKNVSKVQQKFRTETGEVNVTLDRFAENLSFVKRLSETYGQDLISLTDSYAKFLAAGKGTTLALEEQKNIYASLTRAAAAYHLSADNTKDMMNAVIQMMSKGKVAAEELRRQLGNTLPGAFNIMAASMGVSTSKLDEMMKKGEVIASEVLPDFAEELNKITANANFDSIQQSLNRLKNTWTELVNVSGAENLYKGLVDKTDAALKNLAENFTIYTTSAKYSILSLLTGPWLVGGIKQSINYFRNYDSELQNTLASIEKRISSIRKGFGHNGSDVGSFFSYNGSEIEGGVDERSIALMKEHNSLLNDKIKIYRQLGLQVDSNFSYEINALKENNKTLKTVEKGINDYYKKVAKKSPWNSFRHNGTKALSLVGRGFKNIGKLIYGFLGPIGVWVAGLTAVSSIIGVIVGHFKQVREEQERIAAIQGGLEDRLAEKASPYTERIKQVKELKEAFDSFNTNKNEAGMREYFSKLQEEVTALKSYSFDYFKEREDGWNELNGILATYIENLKTAGDIESLINEKSELQGKRDALIDRKNKLIADNDSGEKPFMIFNRKGELRRTTSAGMEYNDVKGEIAEIDAALKTVESKISKLNFKPIEEIIEPEKGDPVGINKIFADYKKKIKELEAAQKEGALSTEEYNDEFHKLNKDTFREAAETGKLSIEEITKKFNDGKILSALEQWYKELSEAAVKATEYETAKEAEKAAERTAEQTAKKIKDLSDDFKKRLSKGDFVPEEVPGRDTRFDYKKTGTETAGEEYDIASEKVENYERILDELKDKYEELNDPELLSLIYNLEKELNVLKASATEWKEAMTLEEIRQDVIDLYKELKDLQTQLGEGIYGFSTGFISSIDSIVGSFERLQEVSDNMDATGWEQFMATFQVFESIMDSVIGTIQTINTLTELAAQIKERETQKINAYNQAKMTENSLDLAGGALKQASAAAGTASAIATEAETGAAIAKTTAKSGEAIAEATAAGAKTGFPALLFAIPAAIAAVVAALASVSKFADGGIVGGNSTRGDKNLARINSGEMILNKSQQGTLFRAIQSGNLGGGGGEWRVRGADLVKVINNTQSRRKG